MKLTTKQLTLCALLTAMALALSYLEGFFPLSLAIPVPGIKLGLANIVTMFALYALGAGQAILILLARCFLGAVFAGNMNALLFSVMGGVTAMVVMILASSAQLVVVNDELVGLRSELQTLQEEETKLMAQYELAYDLQEIEKQMTESGQMNKVQAWQTYTLELSEPDSVEYFQGWDFQERLAEFGRNFLQAVKEYF